MTIELFAAILYVAGMVLYTARVMWLLGNHPLLRERPELGGTHSSRQLLAMMRHAFFIGIFWPIFGMILFPRYGIEIWSSR